jgi:ankyrin repeat protein
MIELDELRNLVHRNEIEKIMATVDQQPALLNHVFEFHSHHTNLLQMAINRNNPQLVRILFDRSATLIEGGDFKNNSIENLLASARYDDPPSIDILNDLLGRGVEFPVKDEKSCHSFIRYSMENIYSYDLVDTLKAMIGLGFDPVAAEKTGEVSMIAKALEGHYRRPSKIAEVLLEQGCSVDALEGDYYSPLDKALETELYRFAAKLLERGANFSSTRHIMEELADHPEIPAGLRDELTKNQDFNGKGERGLPAIHVAAEYDNSEYVSYLVDNGVDINLESKSGTPLIYAVTCNRKKMIKHLMTLGADVNALNGKQETALDIAHSLPGFKHVCSVMAKAGAKTSAELSGSQDQQANVLDSIDKAIQAGEA